MTAEQSAAVERLAVFMGYSVYPEMGFDVGQAISRGERPAYWHGRGKRRRFLLSGQPPVDGWDPFTDANAADQLAARLGEVRPDCALRVTRHPEAEHPWSALLWPANGVAPLRPFGVGDTFAEAVANLVLAVLDANEGGQGE